MIERTGADQVRPADRLVVPVQGTDREFVAQQWAVEFAAALGIPVYAVHIQNGEGEELTDQFDYLRSACEKWQIPLETRVAYASDVVDELVNELDTRDLVILGTRHMAGTYHVGSVASELVRRAPCPVQIVRLE